MLTSQQTVQNISPYPASRVYLLLAGHPPQLCLSIFHLFLPIRFINYPSNHYSI